MFWELKDKELTGFDIVNIVMVLTTFYLMCFAGVLKSVLLVRPSIKDISQYLNIKDILNTVTFRMIVTTELLNYFIMGIFLLFVSIYSTKCGLPLIRKYIAQKTKSNVINRSC